MTSFSKNVLDAMPELESTITNFIHAHGDIVYRGILLFQYRRAGDDKGLANLKAPQYRESFEIKSHHINANIYVAALLVALKVSDPATYNLEGEDALDTPERLKMAFERELFILNSDCITETIAAFDASIQPTFEQAVAQLNKTFDFIAAGLVINLDDLQDMKSHYIGTALIKDGNSSHWQHYDGVLSVMDVNGTPILSQTRSDEITILPASGITRFKVVFRLFMDSVVSTSVDYHCKISVLWRIPNDSRYWPGRSFFYVDPANACIEHTHIMEQDIQQSIFGVLLEIVEHGQAASAGSITTTLHSPDRGLINADAGLLDVMKSGGKLSTVEFYSIPPGLGMEKPGVF